MYAYTCLLYNLINSPNNNEAQCMLPQIRCLE